MEKRGIKLNLPLGRQAGHVMEQLADAAEMPLADYIAITVLDHGAAMLKENAIAAQKSKRKSCAEEAAMLAKMGQTLESDLKFLLINKTGKDGE